MLLLNLFEGTQKEKITEMLVGDRWHYWYEEEIEPDETVKRWHYIKDQKTGEVYEPDWSPYSKMEPTDVAEYMRLTDLDGEPTREEAGTIGPLNSKDLEKIAISRRSSMREAQENSNVVKSADPYKGYDIQYYRYTKPDTNISFFIAMASVNRKEIKVKGNTPEEAITNIHNEIDKVLELTPKINSSAVIDFNRYFVTNILQNSRNQFYAKIINDNGNLQLVIAGPQMLSFGKELGELGFRPSTIRIDTGSEGAIPFPSISYTKNQLDGLGLVANGRYEIGSMSKDKDGNLVFPLKYHSTVLGPSDKLRLKVPALTVAATHQSNRDSQKTSKNESQDDTENPMTKKYPDTASGARQALGDMSDLSPKKLSQFVFFPDPSVEGVWAADHPRGTRVIIYLAGYKTPFGKPREHNDFEEGEWLDTVPDNDRYKEILLRKLKETPVPSAWSESINEAAHEYDVESLNNYLEEIIANDFGGRAWVNGGSYAYLIDLSKPNVLVASDSIKDPRIGSGIRVANWAEGLKEYMDRNYYHELASTLPDYWEEAGLLMPASRIKGQGDLERENLEEDWQKVNRRDKTAGMSKKAVKAYRREHPGSKLQTAVTTKPSKLKKGSKASKRRKSFCARMKGMKKSRTGAKTKRDPNSNINKALRRWNCESVETNNSGQGLVRTLNAGTRLLQALNSQDVVEVKKILKHEENLPAEAKAKALAFLSQQSVDMHEGLRDPKDNPCWKGYKPVGTKKKNGRTVPNCVPVKEMIDVEKLHSTARFQKPTHRTIVDLYKDGNLFLKKGAELRKVLGSKELYVHLINNRPAQTDHPVFRVDFRYVEPID